MNSLLLACMLIFPPPMPEPDRAQILENCHLEIINDQKIMHLKGSPYMIGYQHGSLLKNEIAANIERFITPMFSSNRVQPPVIPQFIQAVPQILTHIPNDFFEEIHGMAAATGLPFFKIILLNLFPEMFHCTGITVNGDATTNGELYHVRVLDYAAGNGLQHTSVLAIVEPDQGQPFLNVTYAGFIGSVTGMNQAKIAIGEIGGKGYGYWDGLPMAFLLRQILQNATSLEEVKETLENTARTCEYYYVFSDGKTGESLACYATPTILQFIAPGESYYKSPPIKNTFETPLITPSSPTTISSSETLFHQLKDTITILRDDQYDILNSRLLENYGHLSVEDLKETIKQPIAHQANLHNAIFAPETLDVWISHAGKNNEPACDEPYQHFNLTNLLGE